MPDVDLATARGSFYRRFVVIVSAGVAHTAVFVVALALALGPHSLMSAVIVFFVGSAIVGAIFVPTWRHVVAQRPEVAQGAAAEDRGDVRPFPPNERH